MKSLQSFKLREYQQRIAIDAHFKLIDYHIVYLAMEVRTGKTLTALETAKLYGAKNVLFLTKKKAISSIQKDYDNFGYSFNLTIINNESVHLINDTFDLLISDEHHRNGAFPKPNKVTKLLKQRYSNLPMIFLSGTPHPESYSQIFHQFWISNYSPFRNYINFYKWANDYVIVTQKYLGFAKVNDYSSAKHEMIKSVIDKYFISFTQKDAGFETSVNENILYCEMLDTTYDLIKRLRKDKVLQGKNEVVLADTGVKEMSKIHQMYSGTVKFESGNTKILDYTKGWFIKDKFKDTKIAIFYKFKAEYDLLKNVFFDKLTDDLDVFNTTDKNIALQIVSGREGISLAKAKYLVYLNIDFSAVSYWQSRDRLTTMDRKINDVYWIFAKNGIENKIYKSVSNKKDFTLNVFKKTYND
jgi:hypothetical protein